MEFFQRLLLIEKSILPDKPVVLFPACLLPLPVFSLSVVLEQPCTELCRRQDSILERTMPFSLVLSNTKADKGLCCGGCAVVCKCQLDPLPQPSLFWSRCGAEEGRWYWKLGDPLWSDAVEEFADGLLEESLIALERGIQSGFGLCCCSPETPF